MSKKNYRIEDKIEQLIADAAAQKTTTQNILYSVKSLEEALGSNHQKLDDINQKLGDYNNQLSIHIAGVKELRTQTEIIRQDADNRLKRLEAPFNWIVGAGVLGKWLGGAAVALSALYGLYEASFRLFS
jgi:uncharacterized coiled-coil protein SlyX